MQLPVCCLVQGQHGTEMANTIPVTPEAIRPLPVAYRVSQQPGRKRRSRSAVIATSTPFKVQLQEAEEQKTAKKRRTEQNRNQN